MGRTWERAVVQRRLGKARAAFFVRAQSGASSGGAAMKRASGVGAAPPGARPNRLHFQFDRMGVFE